MVAMEERVSRLEGAYEQVDRRLGDMNSRLDTTNETIEGLRRDMLLEIGGLRVEMNDRMGAVETRLGTMETRLNAIFIAIMAVGGSIIVALLGVIAALWLN